MGNSSSSFIEINVDRSNAFYFTGESVSGTIGLTVTEGEVEAHQISLTLIGEIGYTTTESSTDTEGNSKTEIRHNDIPFYTAKTVLVQQKSEQSTLRFRQGQYSWPFQLSLEDHLPPSINPPGSYPHVQYYLQVLITKPSLQRNRRERKYLTVTPRVNLFDKCLYLTSSVFEKRNSRDIILKGILNKSVYIPGELIDITLQIYNPKQVVIQQIDLSMFRLCQIGLDSTKTKLFQQTLSNLINFKNEQLETTFSVIIPSNLT